MKTVIKGFIIQQQYSWETKAEITFTTFDYMANPNSDTMRAVAVICPHEFEVETPDNFDPRPQQVQALEREMQKVRADFAASVTRIERQISELTCLEAS